MIEIGWLLFAVILALLCPTAENSNNHAEGCSDSACYLTKNCGGFTEDCK